MSENRHPKTIHLVWLFLAMERQHSTRLAQAIHLGKKKKKVTALLLIFILSEKKKHPGAITPQILTELESITTQVLRD